MCSPSLLTFLQADDWPTNNFPFIWMKSQDSNELTEVEVDFANDGQLASSSSVMPPHPLRAHDQILNFLQTDKFLFPNFFISSFLHVRRPPWEEAGSVVCRALTHWLASGSTQHHVLLRHLRFPQPGEAGSRIYIPHEKGGPVLAQDTGFPLHRLLRVAGLWWRYFNLPPTWKARSPYIYIPQEQDGPVQSPNLKSKSHYDRRSFNQYVWGWSHVTTDG
jgi:hypothetical protein